MTHFYLASEISICTFKRHQIVQHRYNPLNNDSLILLQVPQSDADSLLVAQSSQQEL